MILRFSSPFRYLAAQVRRFFAWIFRYETLVSPEEWAARVEKCAACPHLVDGQYCGVCTCGVEDKAFLATEQCPKKKWLRVWRRKKVK